MLTNILVVGSGGREHALGWKLLQSSLVAKVFFAPGNGGTGNNVPIQADDIDKLAEFAKQNKCFTVVGPELPLSLGLVDKFNSMGLGVFGPTKAAVQLESSKIWAKQFMKKYGILTAPFGVFDNADDAKSYVDSLGYSVVVKAEGLAAGKGVVVCADKKEAFEAIDMMLVRGVFGRAGKRILVEQRIDGIEASYIAICDGNTAVPMATSQDHKRVFDGDLGPNTGGMGAYSPTGVIDQALASKIQTDIIDKTVSSMKQEGVDFKGFLYAGIMVKDGNPYVLEFNARMGDPECQPIVMRLDSDLYEYLLASSNGTLGSIPRPSWKDQSAVCVVMASRGYPDSYPKNEEIHGLDTVDRKGVMVFHAGTKMDGDKILTNGGRVLGVTALGDTLHDAISNAYSAVDMIHWENKFYRKDIAKKGIRYL